MKKFLTLCVIAFSLTACSLGHYDEKAILRVKQEWQAKLETLPVGASEAELTQWLKQNGLLKNGEQPNLSNHKYVTNVPNGYFPFKSSIIFCNGFFTELTIRLDEQNRVTTKKIKTFDSCF
ncbi:MULTISPECIES: hypothetical protein [Kingella]|uniref:hypothetical protein n=2 Tax=Neisseriaceae TaxID=481 RepID=UPI0004293B32|nr:MULTISPECIES: hypothetical protein [Kingella]MDK4536162.1 hypothetical protein [Kingella kingae]MDK4537947.1 hypothetical protein [Kingella kingae]MDK4545924.1 hypothetical protein [Kingella kingae]MDK4621771.1 hypothetical protein [Kingella kingae]MDK4681226.1 hypothetical protein [Kingella negevensis]